MRQPKSPGKPGRPTFTLTVNLDGTGRYDIRTGVDSSTTCSPALPATGRFDLTVTCTGDTWVDDHHTVEDVGISLGAGLRPGPGGDAGGGALRPEPAAHG